MSRKGMILRALYIAWKQAGMAMCPVSVDGYWKSNYQPASQQHE